MRVRLPALAASVVVIIVMVGSGLVIADATRGSSERTASPEPAGSAAQAAHSPAPHGSYCDAVQRARAYTGTDAEHAAALLDHVVSLAPSEVVAVVRDVRAAPDGSPEAVSARHLWDYFNNNHCCECHDAKLAPQISALTPEQRARVEAGAQP